MNKKLLAVAIGLVGLAGNAVADTILFNTNSTDGTVAISGFDWSPSSFVAKGGQTAIVNQLANQSFGTNLDTSFQVMTQASLGTFLAEDGSAISPSGLHTKYEITMVTSYYEKVDSVTITVPTTDPNKQIATADFSAVTSKPAFVEIYINKLTGTGAGAAATAVSGYGYNDGTLIMSATGVLDATGSFTVNNKRADSSSPYLPTIVRLDQGPGTSGGNKSINQGGVVGGNYGTGGTQTSIPSGVQKTVVGSGNNDNLGYSSITQDFSYFLNMVSAITFTNISQNLPFQGATPADCFIQSAKYTAVGSSNSTYGCNSTHVNGLYSAQGAAADSYGYVPNVGDVNGLFGNTPSPDFVGQTDNNMSFSVPEPEVLALLGLAAVGFGLGRRRARA